MEYPQKKFKCQRIEQHQCAYRPRTISNLMVKKKVLFFQYQFTHVNVLFYFFMIEPIHQMTIEILNQKIYPKKSDYPV